MPFWNPFGALNDAAVARALAAKGLSDAQARSTIGSAATLSTGLRAVGLMRAVASPTPTPTTGPVTIDGTVQRSGNVYTFTARRTANIANAETRAFAVAGSSTYAPAATPADFGGAFPSGSINFAAGSATASITVTAPASVQPE